MLHNAMHDLVATANQFLETNSQIPDICIFSTSLNGQIYNNATKNMLLTIRICCITACVCGECGATRSWCCGCSS